VKRYVTHTARHGKYCAFLRFGSTFFVTVFLLRFVGKNSLLMALLTQSTSFYQQHLLLIVVVISLNFAMSSAAATIFSQDGRLSGAMVEANPIDPAQAVVEAISYTARLSEICVSGGGAIFVTSQDSSDVIRYSERDGFTVPAGGVTFTETPSTLQCTAHGVWSPPFLSGLYYYADATSVASSPSSSSCGGGFSSGTFDGRYLWNMNAIGCLARFDTTSNTSESRLFSGSGSVVFDGQFLWLLPGGFSASNDIRRVNGSDWSFDAYPLPTTPSGTTTYLNAVVVAQSLIYLLPSYPAGSLLLLNTSDITFLEIAGSYTSYTAAFDGRYIWFGAYATGTLNVVDTTDNTVSVSSLGGSAARTCAFTGTVIYCTGDANGLIKISAPALLTPTPSLSLTYTAMQPQASNGNRWKVPVIASLVSAGGVGVVAAAAMILLRRRAAAATAHAPDVSAPTPY
jgi:hypothetical protein